jgi:NADH-quinone oxidoreductase subunit N
LFCASDFEFRISPEGSVLVEWQTVGLLWPEVVLIAAASAIFVGGAFTKSRQWWALMALISYIVAGAVLAKFGAPWSAESLHSGPVTIDSLSLGLRWLAILMGLVFTLTATRLADEEIASEYFGSLMLVTVGVMLAASANELILLFLGLELISIPTYVLLFLGRRDRASGEATMKYFYLSILSSALLLYGFSFLYGIGKTTLIAGTAAHPGIREAFMAIGAVTDSPLASLAPLALVLVVAGLGFKLAAAPLQFYAPDVYQGTTSANAGLLAVAPKIAGVAGLVRLVIVAMPSSAEFAWQLALVLAILTMTIGNICALWQRNIRRLMAYSSIAHGGYLLIGLAAAAAASASPDESLRGGTAAMLLYVLVYALATMGMFAALAYLGSARRDVDGVEELAGLAKSQPVIAGAIAVCMFSLAGIPPLAGFWGKLTLFGSAVQLATSGSGGLPAWFTALAIIAALNAAIAAAYYLRIVAVMYFQSAAQPLPAAGGPTAQFAAILCAALVIASGVLPSRLLDSASRFENAMQPAAKRVASIAAEPVATASAR